MSRIVTPRGQSSLFSADYATARSRFRAAATRLGCDTRAYPLGGLGPQGEELTIDVAITPGAQVDRALVISSGIHGVEGFFGSAVQLAALEEWIRQRDRVPRVRCVLLHALNPFGFAWRRRCNETNIDLNRNLLLAGEPFRGSPERYGDLDALLNPKRGPSEWEPLTLRFLLAIARYGMPALKQSIASGQYDYPRGLFYGGAGASRTSEVLSAHFDEWLGGSRKVMHLDLHTGLGAPATCKLLVDAPLTDVQDRQLSTWFGRDAFEVSHAAGLAYTVRGNLGRWCAARCGGRDYLYAAAEFGTYRPTAVLAGLRAENQAHHWGRPDDDATKRAKRRLVELFCPRSETWRAQVLERGCQLIAQALAGLVG